MKKWQAPAVETLEISETMAGSGKTYIDYVFADKDLDVYDGEPGPGSVKVGDVPPGLVLPS